MEEQQHKVCFMTGGSGRLGKQIASAMAREGYDIFFTWHSSHAEARNTLETIQAISPSSAMVSCDISNVDEIKKAFAEFQARFNRLDLLITSASNFFGTPLPDVTEHEWDQLVDTNMKGTFFTMQEGAAIMRNQDFVSRIITITDIAAELTWKNFAPYTASKAAVQHLTKVFAKVFAPSILVNSIAPGTFTINPEWNNGQELDDELTNKIPLKRMGDPEDIIRTIRFLSENDYVTGQVINVDGGRLLS